MGRRGGAWWEPKWRSEVIRPGRGEEVVHAGEERRGEMEALFISGVWCLMGLGWKVVQRSGVMRGLDGK